MAIVRSLMLVSMFIGAAHAMPPSPPSNLQVIERTSTSALLEWTPGAGDTHAFKIRKSSSQGVHPDPTGFPGGKLAAFTWTTDDGHDDNLTYEPIFSSRGLGFTIFVNPATIGNLGKLSWSDIQALHSSGHEIANHTQNHKALIDDRAIALRREGAEACSLAVSNGRLRTWIGGVLDLDLLLTDPEIEHLATLAAFADSHPDYVANLLYAPDLIYATLSQWIDPVNGLQIGNGATAETLTTMRGVHDDAEMNFEILEAQAELEDHLRPVNPLYVCRTLAYPNHAHTQWAMSTMNELGYLSARSGGIGPHPFYSTASFKIGFTSSYEVPRTYPVINNAWTEVETRSAFQSRMVTCKANREWAVFMAHDQGEADAQHLEWAIDEVASDPEVWIARFDEVAEYLAQFATDVGLPIDSRAWVHGLAPSQSTYVVMTAYNDEFEESGWSEEIVIPPFDVIAAPESPISDLRFRIFPNPFQDKVRIEYPRGVIGATIYDLAGRRVRMLDPSSQTWDGRDEFGKNLGSGIYWLRVDMPQGGSNLRRLVRVR